MFPYSRLNNIFYQIKNTNNLTNLHLSELLGVSERTIRSDIQAINNIIENEGAEILLKRRNGYYVNIIDSEKYEKFLYKTKNDSLSLDLENSGDRIKHILCTLLYDEAYISLDALADSVFISKNTLNNYIKTIKIIAENYELEYISKNNYGIKIIGSEENKRKCLLENIVSYNFQDYITGFTKEEYTLFKDINLELIQTIVTKHLKEACISTTDFSRKNLIIHFALMISRIQNNCSINSIQEYSIREDILHFINDIIKDLEDNFSVKIDAPERQYIYSHLMANTDYEINSGKTENVPKIIETLLLNIHNNYHFDLQKDEILTHDLIQHFKSIFNSKSFCLNKRNPLLNTIKNNFPLAYEITLTAVSQTFESYPYNLTDDEIGYVSLHIGAAIERCFSGMIQRKNVILVCGSGQATIRMLEARINIFFKDKITILKKVSYNEFLNLKENDFRIIDFAISTIPVKSSIIPTICVDFALNTRDIESISRFLTNISSDKAKKIDKFFDNSIFIRKKETIDKDTLLKEMCTLLQKNDYVDSHFYDFVMQRENIANTNMNEIFALPHPMELCANQTKVAVAILEKPLLWNEKDTVQIVLLLAIKKDEHIDIEHLYDVFIEIVNNPKLQNEIIHSKTYNEFISVLHKQV